MSIVPTRWLIELRASQRPVGLYLHVHEDDAANGAETWCSEVTRALRFTTKSAADEFIRGCAGFDAVAAPFAAEELVRRPDQISEINRFGAVL